MLDTYLLVFTIGDTHDLDGDIIYTRSPRYLICLQLRLFVREFHFIINRFNASALLDNGRKA